MPKRDARTATPSCDAFYFTKGREYPCTRVNSYLFRVLDDFGVPRVIGRGHCPHLVPREAYEKGDYDSSVLGTWSFTNFFKDND